jgi:hypothetical protein
MIPKGIDLMEEDEIDRVLREIEEGEGRPRPEDDLPDSQELAERSGQLVERKEAPVRQANREEGDGALKVATDDGKRLQKVSIENGGLSLQGTAEAQQRVAEAFGSADREWQTYSIAHLLTILPEGAAKEENDFTLPINAAIEFLCSVAPRDAVESALAAQMAATHHLSMLMLRRAANTQHAESRQLHSNLATKFSRTFAMQLEALNRHRRGGKQVVEHVHVNAGGQAVIAATVNNNRGGGGE